MPDLSGRPDIILVWPSGREVTTPLAPDGYTLHVLVPNCDQWWIQIQHRAVPAFAVDGLVRWLERYRRLALPEGILVATDDETGVPVATAGSIAKTQDEFFPKSGQVAWVATVPEARRRGLATWLSAQCVSRLQQDGFSRIYVSTGDDLTAAIRVYLDLGFVPCLYASDQSARWAHICAAIDRPYRPDAWPTRRQYLAD